MPGSLLDGVDRRTSFEKQGNRCMPQVVKPQIRQSCFLQDGLELFRDASIIERRTDGGGKNEVIFLPPRASYILRQLLPLTMGCELAKHGFTQFDVSSACLGLWRRKDVSQVFH